MTMTSTCRYRQVHCCARDVDDGIEYQYQLDKGGLSSYVKYTSERGTCTRTCLS
jgi:hypothetical protein